MDISGCNQIRDVVLEVDPRAIVRPKPNEGEQVQFVTVETGKEVWPADILNALGRAGLIHHEGSPEAAGRDNVPALHPLGIQPGSITFEDKNAPRYRSW